MVEVMQFLAQFIPSAELTLLMTIIATMCADWFGVISFYWRFIHHYQTETNHTKSSAPPALAAYRLRMAKSLCCLEEKPATNDPA
jgi:hypothetical protein